MKSVLARRKGRSPFCTGLGRDFVKRRIRGGDVSQRKKILSLSEGSINPDGEA